LLVVDYDKERDLKNKLNVRTQSTLIVFKGDKEVARLAGKSDEKSLKEALLK
jgi:thioredoxin-like negative regulator of GroEL